MQKYAHVTKFCLRQVCQKLLPSCLRKDHCSAAQELYLISMRDSSCLPGRAKLKEFAISLFAPSDVATCAGRVLDKGEGATVTTALYNANSTYQMLC